MKIQLSEHFTYKKLIRYSLPSVIMAMFISLYGIMDGLFVSNFADKTSFAAISFILPFVCGMSSFGYMIGTGGAALVAKTLGEQQREKANQLFSMLIVLTVILGMAMSVIGLLAIRPVAIMMGATGDLLEKSVLYGSIMISCQTAVMLQTVFQSLLPAAEKPIMGLVLTVAAGIIDILLNALFIIVFQWGIVGAAASSVIGQFIGCLVPILYFSGNNNSLLRFVRPTFDKSAILKTCTNGSSEMVVALCSSVIGFLYNLQLMRLAGENGVAAYGVIIYANDIFYSIFMGYSTGSSPIVSYHYGGKNYIELKNLCRKSLVIVGAASVVLTAAAILFSAPISGFFVGYDAVLSDMAHRAFALYSISFLFCGFNIWSSGFFTALNDGFVSAVIAFGRTFLFQGIAVIILPFIWGLEGTWMSMVFAEAATLVVAIIFFMRKKRGKSPQRQSRPPLSNISS